MAQADVEIVKECTRRFAAGEDVTDAYFDPEIVWDTSASGLPSAGVQHGHEGVRQFFRDWLAPWTDYAIETRECIDAGDAVVLVFRQAGPARPVGSGPSATSSLCMSWRTRRWCVFACSSRASRPSKRRACRTRSRGP
jgi:ketosteroid isomerase-like protein